MFGLFKNQRYEPSVSEEDKVWIENNISWLIECFGIDHLMESPFILPEPGSFSYTDLTDEHQFEALFKQICGIWKVDPNSITVRFFDDYKSKQWITWVSTENLSEPLGLFNQVYTTDPKRFKIQVAKSNLDNAQLMIYVLSHEIAHVKLLGENLLDASAQDMEPLTDLANIFFGFGIFIANTVITQDVNWMGRNGYLKSQTVSYTNALLCYITGNDIEQYIPYLNTNTRALFKSDYEFLVNTNDTLVNKIKLKECVDKFKSFREISEGFKNKEFEKVIAGSRAALELNPKDIVAYNNIGYALLQLKQYEKAILEFSNAIDIDPYWDYPYNNRGYCKLQLKDFDNAFPDLHSSFEMNPGNSYSWRNMGAYYYALSDFEKAIEYFEETLKINPSTEMIHFYLGKTYEGLGDIEKAAVHLEKSKILNEHNDSLIE